MFGRPKKMAIEIHTRCYFYIEIRRLAFVANPTIREAALVSTNPGWRVQFSFGIYRILYSTSKEPFASGYACKSPK